MSNHPTQRRWTRNIEIPSRPQSKPQINTQMSRRGFDTSPLTDSATRNFNFPQPKRKTIIFEDSHPFSKKINLKQLFSSSREHIIAKKSQISFAECKNVQQLFVLLCLSSIQTNLNEEGYVLMPANEWNRHERDIKKYNGERKFECSAYFVDLDGIDPESIIRKHNSDRQMLTQMEKLQHIQNILTKTGKSKTIVGFIHANAESMEYSCLRPEIKNSDVAIDNLMVTSIGLNERQHMEIVDREWFMGNRKKLLKKMSGQLYLDVSKEFKEVYDNDIAVSVYIRKQRTTKGEVKGRRLDQICHPISNQFEALSAFENGMKITPVRWVQRKRGRVSTVELNGKPFDWDYLTPLREDESFISALQRIYQHKEA